MQQHMQQTTVSEKPFIAGVHSCDKEMKELKKLQDMTILKNFLTQSLDIYDKDNKQLQDEITELCNNKNNKWETV